MNPESIMSALASSATLTENSSGAEVTLDTRITSSRMAVLLTNLAAVNEAAAAHGCEVVTEPVTAKYIWATFWGMSTEGMDSEDFEAAERVAASYVWAEFSSPANDGDVVAIASRKDGVTTFTKVPAREFDWTTERMDGLDWCRCDRCGTARKRKTVYIVRRTDGTEEQLGGSCAKDAAVRLRHQLGAYSALLASMADWDEGFGGKGRGGVGDVFTMLAWAQASINLYGYNKSSSESPTREVVISSVSRMGNITAAFNEELGRIDARALHAEAVAWLDEQRDSDFVRNCKAALESGAIRLAGFLAYIPEGVRRDKERKVADAALAEAFPYNPTTDTRAAKVATFNRADLNISEAHWVKLLADKAPKTVNKKIDGCLSGVWTVLRVKVFEGWEYCTTFITFQRADGASVTWAASGSRSDFEAGEAYRLKGSVEADLRKGKYGEERRIKRVSAFPNLSVA